jgi:hypothetical protein
MSIFQDENTLRGLSKTSPFQVGISDTDPGTAFEAGFLLPWVTDPSASLLGYQNELQCYLDSGIVLHKSLPQSAQPIDTLASSFLTDAKLDTNIKGVNLISLGQFTDSIQRMATSSFRFVIKGWGQRAGYQVPVPGIKTVAGVPAYPDQLQWSRGNVVIGNYSGVPIFFNQWELWYFVTIPPKTQQVPPPNLAQHIRADAQLPKGMQAPYSLPDQQAQTISLPRVAP